MKTLLLNEFIEEVNNDLVHRKDDTVHGKGSQQGGAQPSEQEGALARNGRIFHDVLKRREEGCFG